MLKITIADSAGIIAYFIHQSEKRFRRYVIINGAKWNEKMFVK